MTENESLTRRLKRTTRILIRLLDAIEKYHMQIENDPYLYLAYTQGQKLAKEVTSWQMKEGKK